MWTVRDGTLISYSFFTLLFPFLCALLFAEDKLSIRLKSQMNSDAHENWLEFLLLEDVVVLSLFFALQFFFLYVFRRKNFSMALEPRTDCQHSLTALLCVMSPPPLFFKRHLNAISSLFTGYLTFSAVASWAAHSLCVSTNKKEEVKHLYPPPPPQKKKKGPESSSKDSIHSWWQWIWFSNKIKHSAK